VTLAGKRWFRLLCALAMGMLGPHPNIPHVGYFPIGLTFPLILGKSAQSIHWPSLALLVGIYAFYVLVGFAFVSVFTWVLGRPRA
jgi:hypothetical protein